MNRIILALLAFVVLSCHLKKSDIPPTTAQDSTSTTQTAIHVQSECSYENAVSTLGIGLIIVPEEFEIFNDPALTSRFVRLNMYRDEDSTVCSKFYKPDYGIMHFVCVEVNDKAYKVLVNQSATKYLPKEKAYRFTTWESYILQSFGVRRITDHTGNTASTEALKKEPGDQAETMTIPAGHEMFCPMEMQGDWIKVTYDCFYNHDPNEHEGEPCHNFIGECKEPLTGWLRWKRDNTLLIDIFLMP